MNNPTQAVALTAVDWQTFELANDKKNKDTGQTEVADRCFIELIPFGRLLLFRFF